MRTRDFDAALSDRFPQLDPPVWQGRAATWSVPPEAYLKAAQFLHSEEGAFSLFSTLVGIDRGDRLEVVLVVTDPDGGRRMALSTAVPMDVPTVPSIVPIWPGASFHEREAAEMFGLVFDGHPDPRPLLLDDDFVGHPLRKDYTPEGGDACADNRG